MNLKPYLLLLLAVSTAICGAATASAETEIARREVATAIAAMGGENVLASVHSLEFDAVGHRNMLEQSLRPDGPWWQDYFQLSEIRDFIRQRERVSTSHRGYSSHDWWLQEKGWDSDSYNPDTVIADGVAATVVKDKYSRASSAYLQDAEEDFVLGPIGLLRTALVAPDLHAERNVLFHGFRHYVVAFTWKGFPVRVVLNGYTGLPEQVEWTRPRPYDVFWNVWGDVTTRVVYGMWSLEPDGLRYPRQWTRSRNGLPDSDVSITSLTINPTIDQESLSIPADVRKDFLAHVRTIDELPLGIPGQPAVEIEPGVIHIPGYWNVNLIRQPDGIVVLEGPISSGYSVKVLAEAHKRFPTLPVKAVITTSDSWPHIGGLREYVARGIPIYALDLDKPILERLFKSSHRYRPDDLQKHPRAPKWRLISKRIVLGSGPNRLELIPYHTETGERQTMVYFPQYKLLYTSDLFAPDQG
ncbi:MAG: MBL fold metallo-hydrolase, partial [Gammaproteobacteria bacterium]